MRSALSVLVLGGVLACGGGDVDGEDAGTTGDASGTGATSMADQGADADDPSDDSSGVAGPVQLQADGTFNGEAFSVSCDFADDTVGSRICEPEPGMHTLQCRETIDGTGGVSGQLLVKVAFFATAQLGPTTYTVPGTGVEVGGTLDTTAGAASPNADENVVTLEAFEPGVSGRGTFAGAWSDDGTNHFGSVQGTFDFVCP